MNAVLIFLGIVITLLILINLLLTLFKKSGEDDIKLLSNKFNAFESSLVRFESILKDDFSRSRDEVNKSFRDTREELGNSFKNFQGLFDQRLKEINDRININAKENRDELSKSLKSFEEQFNNNVKYNREELSKSLKSFEEKFSNNVKEFNELQRQKFDNLSGRQNELTQNTETKLDKMRELIESKLTSLQNDNNDKLEKMRETVDEKLHKTLEDRLTKSFESVTKHLLDVQKGLTEMQTLAKDVGGLKNALTNVKTRGVLGEAQLGALLEQFLAKEQYEKNVRIKPKSKENVEFAVKLPGVEDNSHIWLPIDSKFPVEDYYRLMDSYEKGDKNEIEANSKSLETRLVGQAKDIKEKYIDPPNSTDFGLMFLPFEGLYAEALRRPGLFEKLQKEHKVTIVGPTTLTAFLNSLQVGFKTLAISKQSSEVWKVLGAVKTEFGKFGESLGAVQKNLDTASSNLLKVTDRARQMEKKLDTVTALSDNVSVKLLDIVDK